MSRACGSCAWYPLCSSLGSPARVGAESVAGMCWSAPGSDDYLDDRARLESCAIGRKMLAVFDAKTTGGAR